MRDPEFTDDGWVATILRTAIEAMAWVGAPWAAAEWLGLWAAPIAALLVIGVPWTVRRLVPLNPADPGSVSTGGLLRVSMFIDLCVVAVLAAWYLFGPTAGGATIFLAVAALVTGWRRSRWLLAGAPPI
jgi:hypothetical protein